jgi:hypothetical protein
LPTFAEDGKVTPDEFVADWQTFNLGNQQEAQTLFTRADTNDDGFIDSNDIPAIFAFFDQDGNIFYTDRTQYSVKAVPL